MYCSYWEMVNLSLLISFLLVLVKNFCLHSQDTKSTVGSTARKTIFSFSRRPEKMVFPKILRWYMIFLALSRKMMFLFLENMILSPGPKMKDDLSEKSTWTYDISFKCSEKMVFSKKLRLSMIFLVLSGKMVFFSRGHIFLLVGKWKMICLKEYMETWYFLYIRTDATKITPCPSAKTNQRSSYLAKIYLKVIGILDWHPRKSSNIALYFYGDLYMRFHILLSSQKNRKLIGLKFDFFFNLFGWRYSAMKNLCTIQPSGVVFGGALESQSRKLFVHQEMGYNSKNIKVSGGKKILVQR